jgi:hypothetical protein
VEIGPLLKRAMTASFRLAQLESFLKIEDQYDTGSGSFTVYKYTSAGHGVSTSPAPELRPYSALVDTMCEAMMIRQNQKLRAMTGEGMVKKICSMCAP